MMTQISMNVVLTMVDACEQTCNNIVSSYYCSCGAGYLLDSNGHNCSGEDDNYAMLGGALEVGDCCYVCVCVCVCVFVCMHVCVVCVLH